MRWVPLLSSICLAALPALAQSEKPAVRNIPANPNFYRVGRGGASIQKVVIHTIEGSAQSGVNTFRHGARKVSAHYIVDHDGSIIQMVKDSDTAYHAGHGVTNRTSIGIEHAGWADRNLWTPEQMRASARLTRWLCDTYGIPVDRQHIIAHGEVPGAARRRHDPGRFFNWDLYLRLIREGGAAASGAPTPLRPQQGEVVGALRFDRSLRGSATPSQGYRGLLLTWNATGPAPQQAARVFVEEVGGPLRYDSQNLPGAAEQHLVGVALQHGKRYRWRVRTWNGSEAVESPWVDFRVDLTPPRLTLVNPGPGEVVTSTPVIRWKYEDADAPQAGFRVAIDDDADHSTVSGDTKELNGKQAHYYLSSRLQPNRSYWIRVAAHDGRGNVVTTEWREFRTSPDFLDTVGEGLTLRPVSPRNDAALPAGVRPVLRWGYHSSEQKDQVAFRIHVARDGAPEDQLLFDKAYSNARTRAFRLPTTLPPGRYRWRVRVWDGHTPVWSEWSTFVVGGPGSGITARID